MHLTTVGDLLKMLEHQDRSRVVVMQKDPEGNGGALPLDGTWKGAYNTASNQIGLEQADLTPEAIKQGYSKSDVVKGLPAIILFPCSKPLED